MKDPHNHPLATPAEKATADLENQLYIISESLHRQHTVSPQMNLTSYHRMLVLYFHDKSLRDWCRVFHIPDSLVEGHAEGDKS